jgi:hypothetical protein
VVRAATGAPVRLSGPDTVPARPANPGRVAELARRWNLGGSARRLLEALEAGS